MSTADPRQLLAAAIGGTPDLKRSFDLDALDYMSMSNADFGSYDHDTFALSFWYYVDVAGGGGRSFYRKGTSSNNTDFYCGLNGSDEFQIFLYKSDGSGDVVGQLQTSATFGPLVSSPAGVWYHVLIHFDINNTVADDRIKLWIDGTEITSFAARTNPTVSVSDFGAEIRVGRTFEGLMYQPAMFSGSLPSISDVYNASSPATPKDIANLSGLHSLMTIPKGDLTKDAVLTDEAVSPPVVWTNNGPVAASLENPY